MKLPNGYGSIQKLSGNRRKPYIVRKTVGYDENGVQIRKIVGYFETRTKALQELALFNENPYDIDVRKFQNFMLSGKMKNIQKLPTRLQKYMICAGIIVKIYKIYLLLMLK